MPSIIVSTQFTGMYIMYQALLYLPNLLVCISYTNFFGKSSILPIFLVKCRCFIDTFFIHIKKRECLRIKFNDGKENQICRKLKGVAPCCWYHAKTACSPVGS